MLHEIAITPGVFEPEEIDEDPARQQALKWVLQSMCGNDGRLLCNLYNGEWRNAAHCKASPSHWLADYVQSALKVLNDRGRLIPRMGEGQTPPCSDVEWLGEALASHHRVPLYTILTRAVTISDNSSGLPTSICMNLDKVVESPLWTSVSRSVRVERVASKMAQAVAPLLRTCRALRFIDPYFYPGKPWYQNPLREFLEAAITNRYPPKSLRLIEFHTSDKANSDPVNFRDQAHRHLPRNIPLGLRLRLVRWRERERGDSFHNRYILTNHGGVSFLHGLDEKRVDWDDVVLLDEPTRERRWRDFGRNTSPYEYVDELEIAGTLDLSQKPYGSG